MKTVRLPTTASDPSKVYQQTISRKKVETFLTDTSPKKCFCACEVECRQIPLCETPFVDAVAYPWPNLLQLEARTYLKQKQQLTSHA
jgi:hypothetical protein